MSTIPLIPLISLQSLNDPSSRLQVIEELHQCLKSVGFLYLVDHGIDDAVLTRLEAVASRFFSQDESQKNHIMMQNAKRSWRGYFPLEGELTQGKPDYKEGIYFGTEHAADHAKVKAGVAMHGANQWPNVGASLDAEATIKSYMASMELIGQTLMVAIAESLGLKSSYFKERYGQDPTLLFRMFHYPPPGPNHPNLGVDEHTDMGFLTILLQDALGGLEAKMPQGQWTAVPPIRGSLIINIGDMLEYWTHGIYRATLHRVRNLSGKSRYSFPFFYDPSWDALLTPIDAGLLKEKAEHGVRQRWDKLDLHGLDPEMTYGDFVWSKIRNIFPELA